MRRHAKAMFAVTAILLMLGASLAVAADPGVPASCPNAQFRVGPGANLPECRAYEQATPVDKNGQDVIESITDTQPNTAGVTRADGGGIGYIAFGPFARPKWGGGFGLAYVSRRTASGWTTAPPLVPRPVPGQQAGFSAGVEEMNGDMSRSLLRTNVRMTEDTPVFSSGAINFYLQDHDTGSLDHVASYGGTGQSERASSDLAHLAFDAAGTLSDDAGQPDPSVRQVYDVSGGEIHVVSREPGTDLPIQIDSRFGGAVSNQGAISADGEEIFFSSPALGTSEIYRHTDEVGSVAASPSKRTPPDPDGPAAKEFLVATRDGDRVFFRSLERLTDDANSRTGAFAGDLYRYDVEADQLIDLSAGTSGEAPADVLGVVEISDSGDRVYFTAIGQVVPGEGAGDGRPNVYLWEDDGSATGSTRFLATLEWEDEPTWSAFFNKGAQASSDGRFLAFESRSSLTGYDAGGLPQLFLYDTEAGDGDGGLTCISCDLDGVSTGPPLIPVQSATGAVSQQYPRWVSDLGQIVFSSPDPLAAQDTNGKYDAYMWDGAAPVLLSPGSAGEDAYAFGISVSGDDALFRTRERLVPADGDGLVDIYTAHVNGGFASQFATSPPSCAGEECRGAVAQPPAARGPLTSAFQGRGNATARPKPRRCGKNKRRVKARNGKTRCVKRERPQQHRSNRNRRTSR